MRPQPWPTDPTPARFPSTPRRKLVMLAALAVAVAVVVVVAAMALATPSAPPLADTAAAHTPSGSTTAGASATPTTAPSATPTPRATATPASHPTATPTATPPDGAFACDASGNGGYVDFAGDAVNQHVAIKPLAFFQPTYPGYVLPANLPLAPLAWPNSQYDTSTMAMSNPEGGANFGVNYAFALCNLSNQPQSLTSIVVKVAAFTPFSGTLNEVRECAEIYSRAGLSGGGCGGGSVNTLVGNADLTNAGTNAVAVTDAIPNGTYTIPANSAISVGLSLTFPATMGTYRAQVGTGINGGQPVFANQPSPAALLAPVTHGWDGTNCTSAAMQSQIPQTPTTATYICPSP